MSKLNTFLHNPLSIIEKTLYLTPRLWPDALYLKVLYWYHNRKWLNLKNPEAFTEKIQWLKLYDRNPRYTTLVDKLAVKDYVAERIGKEHIIPTLQVWNTVDEINLDTLPNQFVLKTTHGGGSSGVYICRDKKNADISEIKKKFQTALKQDNFLLKREWPYKNVPRRIIAEQFMQDGNTEELKDYKFYCLNGTPHYCQVIADRSTNETIDFYDTQWRHQPFTGLSDLNFTARMSGRLEEKPTCYDEMLSISRILSECIPFVRVDLYQINNKVYFGEMTFFPNSGFGTFSSIDWDKRLGQLLS